MAMPTFLSPRTGKARVAFTRYAPRLVIMAKTPIAGRVKSRLARGVGIVSATAAYRSMLGALIARLSEDRRWTTLLAISPDWAVSSPMFPAHVLRMRQGRGDLGERLQRITEVVPRGPLVVIGSDCPGVTPTDIAAAFRRLGRSDVVLGPSADGGYWLVGLKRRPRLRRAFDNVRWSTAHALADTRANLSGLRIAELRRLADIDGAADLASQRRLIGRNVLPRD
ncbi:MAG: TIGR04282 family arsenosugar biosynthesis glycosyltransferase [Hyphomicrobium sp.]